MNTVSSVSSRCRFMSAIWNSYSKSDTARRPRISALARRPRAAKQRAGPPPAGVLDEQTVECIHLDVRVFAEHLPNDLDALLGGKQRLLFGVDQHGDDDSLEQMRAAENDVDMTVRQRIERPGENCKSPL